MNAIIIQHFTGFPNIKLASRPWTYKDRMFVHFKEAFIYFFLSTLAEGSHYSQTNQSRPHSLLLCAKWQGHFDAEGSSGSLMVLTFAPTWGRKEEQRSLWTISSSTYLLPSVWDVRTFLIFVWVVLEHKSSMQCKWTTWRKYNCRVRFLLVSETNFLRNFLVSILSLIWIQPSPAYVSLHWALSVESCFYLPWSKSDLLSLRCHAVLKRQDLLSLDVPGF